jgi:hypothetical protein
MPPYRFNASSAKPFCTRDEAFQKQKRPSLLDDKTVGGCDASPDPQFDLPPLRPNISLWGEGRRSLNTGMFYSMCVLAHTPGLNRSYQSAELGLMNWSIES